MKKIVQTVSSADRNPAYPITSISGYQSKTSFLGGILGIIFWIILLLLIIQKSITVFGKTQVLVQSFVQRNQDKIFVYPNQSIFKLLIYCADQDQFITYDKQKQYGFQVFVYHHNYWFVQEEFVFKNITTVRKMVPCEDFPENYCIPAELSNLTIECDIQKLGPDGCTQAQILNFRVIQCSRLDPECIPFDNSLSIFMTTGFKNNKFDIFKPKTDQILVRQDQTIQLPITLDSNHQYVSRIMLTKLQIKTDQSIMPALAPGHEIDVIQTWFYPNQKLLYQNFYPNPRKILMSIQFRRSEYTERYRRSFIKIDTMLGEVLGFMGLITWVVSLCCSGYTSYLMKQLIAKKKLEAQPQTNVGGQLQEVMEPKPDANFITYCKDGLRNLKGIFKKQREYYEPKKQIDLMQLYAKVEKHQQLINSMRGQRTLPTRISEPPQPLPLNQKRQSQGSGSSTKKQQGQEIGEGDIKRSLMTEQHVNQ